jgi:hypothetical protein
VLFVLRIVVEVDRPAGQAIGIKEALAMYLEQFGDARVLEIKEVPVEQMKLEGVGLYGNKQQTKRGRL